MDEIWPKYEYFNKSDGQIYTLEAGPLPTALANCLDRPNRDPVGGEAFLIIRVTVDFILTTLIILVNSVTLLAIVLYRRKHHSVPIIRTSSTSMKFVLNLAVADVCVGLCIPYYLLARYFCFINEYIIQYEFACMLKYVSACFSSLGSNGSIIAIAVDRYIAIVYPLRYRSIMTTRVCYMTLAAVWFCSLVPSSIMFFWNHWTPGNLCDLEDVVPYVYIIVIGSIGNIAILGIVLFIHLKLHKEASLSNEKKRSRESSLSATSCDSLSSSSSISTKSAKTVILITGVYFLCWTPYTIVLITRVFQSKLTPNIDLAFQIAFPFSYLNSLLNPFVYAWRNGEVSAALKWFLRSCRAWNQEEDLWIKRPADQIS